MKYSKEDYNFIKYWLNRCIKNEQDYFIYYITSPNIVRQLKYNRLYNENKEIKIDLTKMTYKDNIILEQDLKQKENWVNHNKIWSVFNSKYNYNYQEINKLIEDILCDILKCKEYTMINLKKINYKNLCDIKL